MSLLVCECVKCSKTHTDAPIFFRKLWLHHSKPGALERPGFPLAPEVPLWLRPGLAEYWFGRFERFFKGIFGRERERETTFDGHIDKYQLQAGDASNCHLKWRACLRADPTEREKMPSYVDTLFFLVMYSSLWAQRCLEQRLLQESCVLINFPLFSVWVWFLTWNHNWNNK